MTGLGEDAFWLIDDAERNAVLYLESGVRVGGSDPRSDGAATGY
jgi:hypothetical protein